MNSFVPVLFVHTILLNIKNVSIIIKILKSGTCQHEDIQYIETYYCVMVF